jgi:hypothetical protein
MKIYVKKMTHMLMSVVELLMLCGCKTTKTRNVAEGSKMALGRFQNRSQANDFAEQWLHQNRFQRAALMCYS